MDALYCHWKLVRYFNPKTRTAFSFLRPFPTEDSVEDEDIYNHLEDLIEYALHPFVSSHILKNILRWISNTHVTF